MTFHIATDVGGTFTDLVMYNYDPQTLRGELSVIKVDTTPGAFEQGVLHALERSGADMKDVELLAHGSTVVINALTERRGAKTGLITTRGFRDVLEIARGNRPDLFNLNFSKPTPFVERYLRREITERITYQGQVKQAVVMDELREIAAYFKEHDVQAIAVCCLHAYRNPINEAAIATELRALLPEVVVVASHEISREWREYERSSTTVCSAYVAPVVGRYVRALQDGLQDKGFSGSLYFMQSNAGMTNVSGALSNPVSMVESGPSAGMLAARALGELIGEKNIIALDVGGTTAKCSLIHAGRLSVITEYHIERSAMSPGYPIQAAVIDLVEIGNGGGSIASVDIGGRLSVGPKSAGSMPGPVAYGRGGKNPTTTDAHLLLGRLDVQRFLAGTITVDSGHLEHVFAELGKPLSLDSYQAACGVLRLANANMVNALKLVSTNKGYDPRDFALMAFGGGGALHAIELAEQLRIPRVIIPINSAVFSAWGMLLTDVRRDYTQTHLIDLGASAIEHIADEFALMHDRARTDFKANGLAEGDLQFEHFVDLRYQGQEHTVKVSIDLIDLENKDGLQRLIDRFHEDHESRYTFRLSQAGVQLVNFHLVASSHVVKPKPQVKTSTGRSVKHAEMGQRMVYFERSGKLLAQIYDGSLLEPGMRLTGPAVVQDISSCVVLPPCHVLHVDSYGNQIVELFQEMP